MNTMMPKFDETLSKTNIQLFAIRCYDNPTCSSIEEFNEDFNRTKYLKKLFETYFRKGILKERLILNHLIIFFNVFGIFPASQILYFKLEPKYWSILKTFLVYLNLHKNLVLQSADTERIPIDMVVAAHLRQL